MDERALAMKQAEVEGRLRDLMNKAERRWSERHRGTSAIIVYGFRCLWWDSIDEAGTTISHPLTAEQQKRTGLVASPGGLPCCPFCRGVLLQVDSEEEWFRAAGEYEAQGHPGYVELIRWARGKCFPTRQAAVDRYREETGIEVMV